QVAQRVEVYRVEIVGRDYPAQPLHEQVAWRVVEAAAAPHPVPDAAPDRREALGIANCLPEAPPMRTGSLGTAALQPVRENDGIHCPGAGAADRADREPVVLEQAVEHTPGQRSVRSATLQCQIDPLALTPGPPAAPFGRRHPCIPGPAGTIPAARQILSRFSAAKKHRNGSGMTEGLWPFAADAARAALPAGKRRHSASRPGDG